MESNERSQTEVGTPFGHSRITTPSKYTGQFDPNIPTLIQKQINLRNVQSPVQQHPYLEWLNSKNYDDFNEVTAH